MHGRLKNPQLHRCHEAVGINPREPVIRDAGTKNEEPKRLRDTSSCGKWSEMNSLLN
jgi:hypothetical protein